MGKGYLTVEVADTLSSKPIEYANVAIEDARGFILHTVTTNFRGRTMMIPLNVPDRINPANPYCTNKTYACYSVIITAPCYIPCILNNIQIYDKTESLVKGEMMPNQTTSLPPINQINQIYPGTALRPGSRGDDVRLMQTYLNALSTIYTVIPRLTVDGIFGPATQTAVMVFQQIFGLNQDGIIGPITWNAIVSQYNRLPVSPPTSGPPYPGIPLRVGSRGEEIRIMQLYLNKIAEKFPYIPVIAADGVFGPLTENAVRAFQRQFGITDDGIIGPVTWNAIVTQYNNIIATPPTPPYPGTPLRQGSQGEDVRTLQTYLNRLANVYPSIPRIAVDGMFGPATAAAVIAAQNALGLVPDGIVGPLTWNAVVRDTVVRAYTIVLDPGHGGANPGAVCGTRRESDDVLAMSLAVRDRLRAMGQNVIMTRSTDIYLTLAQRSAISNNNNANRFVSIHRNASNNSAANGVETFVRIGAPQIDINFAHDVQSEVVRVGVQSNRGVKQANFAVLRNTRAPAILLELGFITNYRDNQLFDQHFYAYADAIARGIMKSLGIP